MPDSSPFLKALKKEYKPLPSASIGQYAPSTPAPFSPQSAAASNPMLAPQFDTSYSPSSGGSSGGTSYQKKTPYDAGSAFNTGGSSFDSFGSAPTRRRSSNPISQTTYSDPLSFSDTGSAFQQPVSNVPYDSSSAFNVNTTTYQEPFQTSQTTYQEPFQTSQTTYQEPFQASQTTYQEPFQVSSLPVQFRSETSSPLVRPTEVTEITEAAPSRNAYTGAAAQMPSTEQQNVAFDELGRGSINGVPLYTGDRVESLGENVAAIEAVAQAPSEVIPRGGLRTRGNGGEQSAMAASRTGGISGLNMPAQIPNEIIPRGGIRSRGTGGEQSQIALDRTGGIAESENTLKFTDVFNPAGLGESIAEAYAREKYGTGLDAEGNVTGRKYPSNTLPGQSMTLAATGLEYLGDAAQGAKTAGKLATIPLMAASEYVTGQDIYQGGPVPTPQAPATPAPVAQNPTVNFPEGNLGPQNQFAAQGNAGTQGLFAAPELTSDTQSTLAADPNSTFNVEPMAAIEKGYGKAPQLTDKYGKKYDAPDPLTGYKSAADAVGKPFLQLQTPEDPIIAGLKGIIEKGGIDYGIVEGREGEFVQVSPERKAAFEKRGKEFNELNKIYGIGASTDANGFRQSTWETSRNNPDNWNATEKKNFAETGDLNMSGAGRDAWNAGAPDRARKDAERAAKSEKADLKKARERENKIGFVKTEGHLKQ